MSKDYEKIQATKPQLLHGNLIVAVWIVLGTLGCWFVNPWFGWLFLVFSTFSVFVMVRRLLCNSCYYCKSCTKGFAKLSFLFLGAYRIPGLSKSSILGMITFAYVILTLVPGWLIANSLLQEFTVSKLLTLVGLIAISIYGIISRISRRGLKPQGNVTAHA